MGLLRLFRSKRNKHEVLREVLAKNAVVIRKREGVSRALSLSIEGNIGGPYPSGFASAKVVEVPLDVDMVVRTYALVFCLIFGVAALNYLAAKL